MSSIIPQAFSLKRFWFQKTSKAFKEARQVVDQARKVVHYRKDILSIAVVDELVRETNALQLLLDHYEPALKAEVLEKMASLKGLLKQHGGKIYPVGFLADNVEMIVVAAIVAIGFRAFFFQPFKIPTNSMYPSYYGMTETIYHTPAESPSQMDRIVRWVMLGAENYEVLAPESGELAVQLVSPNSQRGGLLNYNLVRADGIMGMLPDPVRSYSFMVNEKLVSLKVPLDYNLDDVFLERFFPNVKSLKELLRIAGSSGKIKQTPQGYFWFTGISLKKGDPILNFDILSGDRLFVDRMTYNFRAPKVGEAIVFYTRKIKGLRAPDGTPDDRYYIKRLVGLPGDRLEIKPPALFRNGEIAKGAKAFAKNAIQEGLYPGYINRWDMPLNKVLEVGPEGYFALGDNSPGSLDSRQWGLVPPREVIGRAVFIYYPFTTRWGVSD